MLSMRRLIRIVESQITAVSEEDLIERSQYGSAWVLIACQDTDEVLLAKRSKSANNPGQWNLFGGGLEKGETAQQTAVRELSEEAGISIEPSQLSFKGEFGGMRFYVIYATRSKIDGLLRPNKKEVARTRWFSLDALPQNLHKSTKAFIRFCTKSRIKDDGLTEGLCITENIEE